MSAEGISVSKARDGQSTLLENHYLLNSSQHMVLRDDLRYSSESNLPKVISGLRHKTPAKVHNLDLKEMRGSSSLKQFNGDSDKGGGLG